MPHHYLSLKFPGILPSLGARQEFAGREIKALKSAKASVSSPLPAVLVCRRTGRLLCRATTAGSKSHIGQALNLIPFFVELLDDIICKDWKLKFCPICAPSHEAIHVVDMLNAITMFGMVIDM